MVNLAENIIYSVIFPLNIVKEVLKMASQYKSISLPAELVKEIQEFIQKNRSFTSVSDFVKFAVREELKSKQNGGHKQ